MASEPIPQLNKQPQSSGSPYCADPNCESCKKLREMQEAIRLRQPLPTKRDSAAAIGVSTH
jgi:hypothetical protein